MLLVIDIGNTNIVFGFYDGKKLVASMRIATDSTRTADESAMLLEQFRRQKNLAAVTGIAVANVVPKLDFVFLKMAKDHYGLEPLFVRSTLKYNITFDYPNPSEIGADRICNSVAAFERFGGPTIVVDFGTATTFDIISKEGAYLGGVIAPGIETALSALAHRAAQLFSVSLTPPKSAIGKSTEEALKSGFYYGALGQIEHVIAAISREFGAQPKVVATGGLASAIAPGTKMISEILPDITLDGLRLIYEMNR
jgi:type III pantothenate kinase